MLGPIGCMFFSTRPVGEAAGLFLDLSKNSGTDDCSGVIQLPLCWGHQPEASRKKITYWVALPSITSVQNLNPILMLCTSVGRWFRLSLNGFNPNLTELGKGKAVPALTIIHCCVHQSIRLGSCPPLTSRHLHCEALHCLSQLGCLFAFTSPGAQCQISHFYKRGKVYNSHNIRSLEHWQDKFALYKYK